ncbi:hypothetical protein [Prodigiosinella confusarubida]|nr:hypothetical protein [Serratia sp. ATCC 39006]
MNRQSLIPYMREYEEKFTDGGLVRWLPYLMYFHPVSHVSPVVNTDKFGFRYAEKDKRIFSVAEHNGEKGYKLLAGNSTVFGIGATTVRFLLGIPFINSTPLIRDAIKDDEWIFVDRIHFTDHGHRKVSQIILDAI